MYNSWLVVALSLAAALAFATSTTLKHASASELSFGRRRDPGVVLRFVLATLAHRLWLGGVVADVVGLGLQILALHAGPLALVQPLLVTALLFALLMRRREHPIDRTEVTWGVVLVGTLIGFVMLASASDPPPSEAAPDHAVAAVGAAAALLLVIGCVRLSATWHRHAPLLMGVAVGTTYAVNAALLKVVTDKALQGLPTLLRSWELYAVVLVGATGVILNQFAFQAGPLTASLPAISTVDPLLSVAIGVFVFDETLHAGGYQRFVLFGLLVLLAVAVIRLARMSEHESTPTGSARADDPRLQPVPDDGDE